MQPWLAHKIRDLRVKFQSSSGQKAGCNSNGTEYEFRVRAVFQSSSGQKAGCNAGSKPG